MQKNSIHSERLKRLKSALREKKVDSYIAVKMENIFYLTGFTGSAGLLFVNSGEAVLLTDQRYAIQAKKEVTGARVVIYSGKKEFIESLKKVRGKVVGFNSQNITHYIYKMFKNSIKEKRFKDIGPAVENLRQIKDLHELKIIKSAVAKAKSAFLETIQSVRAGDTELDIKSRLESAIRTKGCDKESFDTIVASGKNSALVHGRPGKKRIKEGDLILLDYGVKYKGYCTDVTRTFVLGEPTKRQRGTHNIVRDAQKSAIAGMRDGVSSKHIDSIARDIISKSGYKDYFSHGLGHGLGIEVHELPRLSSSEDFILREGMVLTVEPGIYIENFGGIRIEDMVYITKTGSKVLTNIPRDLVIQGD